MYDFILIVKFDIIVLDHLVEILVKVNIMKLLLNVSASPVNYM